MCTVEIINLPLIPAYSGHRTVRYGKTSVVMGLMERISQYYPPTVSFFEMQGVKEYVTSGRKELAAVVGLGLSHGFALPVMGAGIKYLWEGLPPSLRLQ